MGSRQNQVYHFGKEDKKSNSVVLKSIKLKKEKHGDLDEVKVPQIY